MNYIEIINDIFKNLKDKYVFYSKKSLIIENIHNELKSRKYNSEWEFYRLINMYLSTLKDPHISFIYPENIIGSKSIGLFFNKNKCYYSNNNKTIQIAAINGIAISDYLNRFNYENAQSKYEKIYNDVIVSSTTVYLESINGDIVIHDFETTTKNSDIPLIKDIKSLFISSEIIDNYGIIKITSFMPEFLYDEYIKCLSYICNCDFLIVDLRINRGGVVETAKKVVSHLILNPVTLYFSQQRTSLSDTTLTEPQEVIIYPHHNCKEFKKIFILQDEFTGSCSENVFINALKKSNKNCISIGSKTSGMCNEATMVNLADGSRLQITNRIFSEDGEQEFNTTGLLPDFAQEFNYVCLDTTSKKKSDYESIIEVIKRSELDECN